MLIYIHLANTFLTLLLTPFTERNLTVTEFYDLFAVGTETAAVARNLRYTPVLLEVMIATAINKPEQVPGLFFSLVLSI